MTKITLRNPTPGLVLLATIGVSCGGGGGALTQGDFCAKKAEAECNGVATKCVVDANKCKTIRVTACQDFAALQQQQPSALARPFRPDLAQDCIDKTAAVYTKTTITPADRAPMEDACARVFSGKKKDSDTDKPTCTNDYECDAPQICDPGFILCAVKKSVGAGAYCNNPGEVCVATEYCNTEVPRDCVARPALGAACSPAVPCLDTQRCSAGMCAERVGLGMACAQDSDCKLEAPYCDPFNGYICVAGFTPSTGVAECVIGFGGLMTGGGSGGTAGGGTGGAGGA